MAGHPVFRVLHDAGLYSWAGGTLMGAVGLNGAAAALDDPTQRAAASTAGWSRWAPVNAAGVVAHLAGASGLLVTDWDRVRHQRGVGLSSAIKTVVTGAGLGVAAWSAVLNRQMAHAGPAPVQGATEPNAQTPPDVARIQKQLKLVQWLNPAVSFGIVALSSWQSEQQRPTEVAKGTLQRVVGRVPVPAVAAATAGLGLLLAARRRRSGEPAELSSGATDAPYDLAVVDVVEVDVVGGETVDLSDPTDLGAAGTGRSDATSRPTTQF